MYSSDSGFVALLVLLGYYYY